MILTKTIKATIISENSMIEVDLINDKNLVTIIIKNSRRLRALDKQSIGKMEYIEKEKEEEWVILSEKASK